MYVDNYLEIPLDLSKCIFMFTSNDTNDISNILLNRLKKIYLNDYDEQEKIRIIKDFSINKIKKRIHGADDIIIPEDVIKHFVR